MPKYARQPAGKNSHRRIPPNSHRAAIVPSISGIPKPRRVEPRIQNQSQFLARRAAVAPNRRIQNQTQSPHHRTRRFITIHHFSSQFRVYAGRLRGVPRNLTELETKANFLRPRCSRLQIQNQTQSGRHPTRRFITIHHFSSQFRIHAGRLPGRPTESDAGANLAARPLVLQGCLLDARQPQIISWG